MEQNKKEIPMNDIPDIPRQIAVAFASIYIDMRDTVKLASDIQNYAIEFADQQVALNGEWNRVEDCLPVDEKPVFFYTIRGISYIGIRRNNIWQTMNFYKFIDCQVTHWKPISAPGSNQGPTKVQLIETIAERDQVIRELEAELKKKI